MNSILIVQAGIALVVVGILWLRMHAFLALILSALVVASLTPTAPIEAYAASKKMPPKEAQEFIDSASVRVTREFGNACARVGVLIAMASIVGKCLMESGAADRIVRAIVSLLGERRAPIAFLFSGYFLSVPVFFDNVFMMMVPLAKAMWMRTGKNYLLCILAVIAGGSMDLSLMPPGPGPSAVAAELSVDKGLMMLFGALIGGCAACVGMTYATWMDRRMQLPVRDALVREESGVRGQGTEHSEERKLPPLGLALVPVLMPVLLIAAATFTKLKWNKEQIAAFSPTSQSWIAAARWLGEPSMALSIAAVAAILVLVIVRSPRKDQLKEMLGKSLVDGGQILLLIAAGGAFGGALQHTGIGLVIQHWIERNDLPVLPVAFLVTTLVRAAQGSATVAMMTTAGMFASMATAEKLGFHPVYLALMIGCGSKPLAWMNDAGFWMISKMSGMTESETLKTFSVQMTIEGIAGGVIVMVLTKVMPMV